MEGPRQSVFASTGVSLGLLVAGVVAFAGIFIAGAISRSAISGRWYFLLVPLVLWLCSSAAAHKASHFGGHRYLFLLPLVPALCLAALMWLLVGAHLGGS